MEMRPNFCVGKECGKSEKNSLSARSGKMTKIEKMKLKTVFHFHFPHPVRNATFFTSFDRVIYLIMGLFISRAHGKKKFSSPVQDAMAIFLPTAAYFL
jgi:hypothetical protein